MTDATTETTPTASPIGAGTATKKAPAKKAPAAKKTAPAKKAPAKKAAAPAKGKKAVTTNGDLFRAGSTKAAIFDYLKGGAKRTRESLKEICEKAEKSPQLISWVLQKAAENGYKVEADREHVQISKK